MGHIDIEATKTAGTIRRKVERLIIGSDERCKLIIAGIDANVLGRAPRTIRRFRTHINVHSAASAFSIAREKEKPAILADAWLRIPPFGINGLAEIRQVPNLAVDHLGLIDVARLENRIRPVARADDRSDTVARNRKGTYILLPG